MQIFRVKPEDASELTMIAFTAKRHWGYPESWIRKWEDALTITSELVRDHVTYVASVDGKIGGFYLLRLKSRMASLEHLWVLPHKMKQGIGRALFKHAEEFLRKAGVERIEIESDPNAEKFYVQMGAVRIGQVRADVDQIERFLPIMEKKLKP